MNFVYRVYLFVGKRHMYPNHSIWRQLILFFVEKMDWLQMNDNTSSEQLKVCFDMTEKTASMNIPSF